MDWTKEEITIKMKEIRDKGFLSVSSEMFRKDDGVVGQLLEREFGVEENNLHLADLGTYELKGQRIRKGKSSPLTLFHKTSTSGMTPNEIFGKYSYEKKSNRDETLKRKLFGSSGITVGDFHPQLCPKSLKLSEIKQMGWIKNRRYGNAGGVGNTLEDLLEVAENNLQLPDFGDWELKSQRAETGSLLTLFHMEPKPRNAKIVPQMLLLKYGWPHQEAGIKYPENEKSFRQTINTTSYSDRGFCVNIDYNQEVIYISFDYSKIDNRHYGWRQSVEERIGKDDLSPNPFWTFADIEKKLKVKINNMLYVRADTKIENGEEYFKYNQIEAYVDPTLERFLNLVEEGVIYVDFDARTGHNHGTKFRIRPSKKVDLFESRIRV